MKSVTEQAAYEKAQLQNKNDILNSQMREMKNKNEALSKQISSALLACKFFAEMEKFAGRKLSEGDIEKLRSYLSQQEDRGKYFSRIFK